MITMAPAGVGGTYSSRFHDSGSQDTRNKLSRASPPTPRGGDATFRNAPPHWGGLNLDPKNPPIRP